MLLLYSANGRSYHSIPFPEIVSDSLSQELFMPSDLGLFFWFNVTFSTNCDGGNGFTSVRTKNIAYLDVTYLKMEGVAY